MNLFKRYLINMVAASYLLPSKLRHKIYKVAGMNFHTTGIRAKCFFNSENVRIGKNSSINFFCQFHSTPESEITIGENVYVGMNVNFCTITHEVGTSRQRAGEHRYLPIIVEDGVWIGANSVILPGVTIGKGSIIAAGSIVNRDCDSNGLYAGVSAKKIKDLS